LPRRYAVSTGSDSDRVVVDCENRDCQDYYPVAIAPGTDLIRKLGHYRGWGRTGQIIADVAAEASFSQEKPNNPLTP